MDKISNSELADVIGSIIIDSANNRPDIYEKEGLSVREAKAFAFGISLSNIIVESYASGIDPISVVEAAIDTLSQTFRDIESEDDRSDSSEKVEP